MSWEDLETAVAQETDEQADVLRTQVTRALDANPVFEQALRRFVQAGTYASGRTLDQVAFSEGQRALARTFLQLGGRFDE